MITDPPVNPPTTSAGARSSVRVVLACGLGALVGLPLGAVTAASSRSPILAGLLTLTWLAIAALLIVVLLVVAAATRRPHPRIAAAGLAGGLLVGGLFGPAPEGTGQSAAGTGAAGTPEAPGTLWTGPIECRWQDDSSAVVSYVGGFDAAFPDPAVLEAEDAPTDLRVVGLLFKRDTTTGGSLSVPVDGGGALNAFQFTTTDVLDRGREGIAVSEDAGLVFSWSCERGP
jgi:hypothetical protein